MNAQRLKGLTGEMMGVPVRSPTVAQHRVLSAAAVHKTGRVVGGDSRTRDTLIVRGWIEIDGYYFGPLFKITDAGRNALNAKPPKVQGG